MPLKHAVLLAAPLLLLFPAGSLAQAPESLRAEYDLLQQGRYRTAAVDVPSGGIRWSFGEGTWTLESGRLWLAEPTAGGAEKPTSLVFNPDDEVLAKTKRD